MRKGKLKEIFFISFILVSIFHFHIYAQDTMKYAEVSDPRTLNPLQMKDTVSFRFSDLIYNALISVDVNMIPKPDLLKNLEPKISKDGLLYTFKLKKGIKWHDGRPLTSEDVKFTINLILNRTIPTTVQGIRNDVDRIFADNPTTFTIKLRKKLPKELVLGKLSFKILPKHILNDREKLLKYGKSGKDICGTGPYKLDKWIHQQGIRLLMNKNFFKKFPPLKGSHRRIKKIIMIVRRDEVVTKDLLINGAIHLIPLVRPVDYNEIRSNPYCTLKKYNTRSFVYFAFNCKHSILKIKKVRQALTFATNRKEMLEKIYGKAYICEEQIISGPFPPGEGDPSIKPRPYDPKKAKELLTKAGFKMTKNGRFITKDGKQIQLTLKVYVKNEDFRRICTMFAQQLESVGIKLKIRFLELNRWLKEVMLDRDFEIAFGEWTFNIDTNIIETLFSSASLKSGGNNFVSYSNPKIDELLTVNKFCFDPDKRIKNKYAMHKIIHEDCPYIFLFSLPQYAGIRSNILKNVEIHPYNFFLFITSWHLSEEELGF